MAMVDDALPRWRRPLLAVLRRRPSWATAYARRQVRLADEDLVACEPLAAQVDAAADAVENSPLERLAQRHRGLRHELYRAVRAAERRLARSGSYHLVRAGLVTDPATARVVSYVEDEVRPALDLLDEAAGAAG